MFEVVSRNPNVPSFVWIVAGDMPAIYMVVDRAPNWVCAFDVYRRLALDWVYASAEKKLREEVFPFHKTAYAVSENEMMRIVSEIDEKILKANRKLLDSTPKEPPHKPPGSSV